MFWKETCETWLDQGPQDRDTLSWRRRFVSDVRRCGRRCDLSLHTHGCRPKATVVMSPADRDIVARDGLAVVECSWARIDDIPFSKIASPNERLCTWTFRSCFRCIDLPCCVHSALPPCCKSHKLWQTVAFKLRRSSCGRILSHRI